MSTSHIRIEWNAQYKRQYRQIYNSSTGQWQFLDWEVGSSTQTQPVTNEDYDKRRDSGGLPTLLDAGLTSGSDGQNDTAEHQGRSYTQSSMAPQGNPGMYLSPQSPTQYGYYGAANNGHVSVGAMSSAYSNNYSHHNYSGVGQGLLRGEGPHIEGSYTGQNLHYEELDQSYFVRSSEFFQEGKVFAVMWNETASANSNRKPVDYNTSKSLSEVKHAGNIVYTNVRRFIVVRRKHEFCFACPIFTYSGRATTKWGVRASEHAIAYSWGKTPQLLNGEDGITKKAVVVVMATGVPPLSVPSRIYFGIHHPIQYNVKVKEIGYVPQDQIATLIGNWQEENGGTH